LLIGGQNQDQYIGTFIIGVSQEKLILEINQLLLTRKRKTEDAKGHLTKTNMF